MFKPGRMASLKVERIDDKGAWMATEGELTLMPKKEVPDGTTKGDLLNVFLYLDASNRPTATCRKPKGEVGEFVLLKVVDLGPPGAFLDWGLDKNLLVPYSEQPEKMEIGSSYLVKICLDQQERIVGTAFIEECLEREKIDLRAGEQVDLQIWTFTPLGAKVIIEGVYEGLLFKDELHPGIRRGQHLTGSVKQIRDDRKIDVTLRRGALQEIDAATETILTALRTDPVLPLGDKSPPEEIFRRLGLSKKLFKKTIGGLYRQGLIEPGPLETRLKNK
ncbi:MAG: GntR family transcriptional regulator [Desulfuromonadales bacterium]|nr:GntR family transcriptional regulator [Desulfuromonadales bacterium]